ncbi:translation initiation factor IF-2-like [Cyprinodon tularosa]|uniref:translation initiation factor IF-2-like n=1 Tax=Cyprinodon tularosa TaxID=77115 RepID=UPI0018E1E18E|nr:translation initiation factor IF-2-like [Cyprinodon tularosa]
MLPGPSAEPTFCAHASDQMVPDPGAERISLTTSRDMEFLQQAIKELRAERLEQLKQLRLQQVMLEQQVESDVGPFSNPIGTEGGGGHTTPPPGPAAPLESLRLTPGRKAVAAKLDSIHSRLQIWDNKGLEDRQPPAEAVNPGAVVGSLTGPPQNDTDPSSLTQAAATELCDPQESNRDKKQEETDQREKSDGPSGSAGEDSVSRSSQSNQEQAVDQAAALQSHGTTDSRIPVLMHRDRDPVPGPAVQNQQLIAARLPPCSQQPQQNMGLLQNPHLPPFHGQRFPPGPLLGPLTPLGGGLRGVMAAPNLWPGGFGPPANPLVWGFQPSGMDFLGGFYGQGGNSYRGVRPGGGFNRM